MTNHADSREESRREFEETIKLGAQFTLKVDLHGDYVNHETRMKWIGWQAATARMQAKVDAARLDSLREVAAKLLAEQLEDYGVVIPDVGESIQRINALADAIEQEGKR